MSARFWAICSGLWVWVSACGCSVSETGHRIAVFAAARARGCQQRMRQAIGLPPIP